MSFGLIDNPAARYAETGFVKGPGMSQDLVERTRRQLDDLGSRFDSNDVALDVRGNIVFQVYDVPLRPAPLGSLPASHTLSEFARLLLGTDVSVAWALVLNKVNDSLSNWAVPWHQDTSVYCVRTPRGAVEDSRGGFATFRPRDDTMGRLAVARVALDADTHSSGCLYVAPGSHKLGNQWPDGARRLEGHQGTPVELAAKETLFFNPLLMHRADNSASSKQRRVLHIYYRPADMELPDHAEWIEW